MHKKSQLFWSTASKYLDHHLKEIRQLSPHTIKAYRDSLNNFIDFLETVKLINRREISFNNFEARVLQEYQEWMISTRKLSAKTCNLRLTAIRALLEYASEEHLWVTPLYSASKSIPQTKTQKAPIEFFESKELKALLSAPSSNKKSERRNKMMLLFLYETAARVTEARSVRVGDLHLHATIPYVTLLGKGRKCRSIPLSALAVKSLNGYLREFHPTGIDAPLFFSIIDGEKKALSSDTFEKMIKRYCGSCVAKGIHMPERVHCHMIRKTRAMDLYRSGLPLPHIQQLLGHESISTTNGFYAFATLETLAKAMDEIHVDSSVKRWANKKVLNQLLRL